MSSTSRPEPTSPVHPDEEHGRTLSELLEGVPADLPEEAAAVRIREVTADSRAVRPGVLFVALRGTRTDGHDFVHDAVRRGAAAVVVEEGLDSETIDGAQGDRAVPVVRVESTRRALARIGAAWHGHPARGLRIAGITGTLGKTSTLSILEAVMEGGGERVASVGSLGLRIEGRTLEESGYTAPDPLLLHRQLARATTEGCRRVAMEVTSHALEQERVAGLVFDLGVFTGLVPLEHSDYHGSFRRYAEAKARFFEHLESGAPLVFDADDRAVRRLVHDADADPVGCGTHRTACVRIRPREVSARGTRLELDVRRPLPRVDGAALQPVRIPLEIRLLGRSNLSNAALAATAALCLGVDPGTIREVLPRLPPPPRRMEVIHDGRFLVLDDTVGHPDSFSALFEVVEKLDPRRVLLVYAVRGGRGERINRQNARTLGAWTGRLPVERLVVTRSAEAVGDADRVEEGEHRAFLDALPSDEFETVERERLEDAVVDGLRHASEGDLVLLLGAQGMDEGARIARAWLDEREE